MANNRGLFPVWVLYAVLCIVFWGLWGFLAKIGSASASPFQLQVLFSFGMVPVALAMLFRMRWKLDRDWKGLSFGVLTGVIDRSRYSGLLRCAENGRRVRGDASHRVVSAAYGCSGCHLFAGATQPHTDGRSRIGPCSIFILSL